MSLYRPVYQSVLTQEPIDETPENRWEGESNGESRPSGPPDVKRRGRSVRDRLNTIVSMYVPSSGQQRIQPSRLGYQAVPTREKEDKAKCPSSEGTTVATTAGSISLNEVVDGSDTNYEIQFLFRGLDLIDELCKCVSAAPSIKDTGEAHARARKIVALAYAADSLLICLEDLPYIFIIAAPGSSIPLAGKEEEVSYMPRSSESTSHPQSGCSHGLQERAQTMVGEPGVSQYLEPEDVVIQTWIHLNLGDNGELYPSEICARGNANTGSLEEVYVTGRTFVAEMKKGPKLPHFLLLRLTLNDAPPLRSRVYDYQRYAGVDIDADGHLLLACPAILRPSEKANMSTRHGAISSCLEDKLADSVGQLCKLTPGLERRVFSLSMGSDAALYRPDWVAQETAGNLCWASVRRWPQIGLIPNVEKVGQRGECLTNASRSDVNEAHGHESGTGDCRNMQLSVGKPRYVSHKPQGHNEDRMTQKAPMARRLFAFPGRCLSKEEAPSPWASSLPSGRPNITERHSPKEWLQVVSWEFSDLCPGRIAAYDANRLLVLDAITGSLAYIAWSPGEATPSLYRITKPSEHLRIELICTTFRRRPGIEQLDQNDLGQLAYFTANGNLYRFRFKDSHIT